MKLNQVIAIVTGEKSKKQTVFSKIYHLLQKEDLFNGLTRRYEPFEDDATGANRLPDEDKMVQYSVKDVLEKAREVLEPMFNMVATQDAGNTEAKADIVIEIDENNSLTIAEKVPVTTLIFLEKQLADIRTFVSTLPVLDPVEEWERDNNTGLYKSLPKKTIRPKKVMKNHVKAEATDKHPAQVEVYTEDVPIGTWTTVKFSGAVSQTEKDEMLERVNLVDKAIKVAREEANSVEVKKKNTGGAILEYVIGR